MARRITSPETLTRAEAAQALGVHPATVARWAAAGTLPSFRTPSGERRYRRCDVETLLNRESWPMVRRPPNRSKSPPKLS
jgi:excisionase family DNA binding protein